MQIKVLIADDSSFQRKVIAEMLSEHHQIEIVGLARDGLETIELIEETKPDVILLDLVMPKMDGLTVFKKIMKTEQIPTIIFSVLDPNTLDASIKALLMGAFDYIIKPGGVWKVELPKFKNQLISKVILASKSKRVNLNKSNKISEAKQEIETKSTVKQLNEIDSEYSEKVGVKKWPFNVIAIGTSVGGPKTLRSILNQIPKDLSSPILIVQHLNEDFMEQFAQSLNNYTSLEVKVGENGEKIKPSKVYIAPGGKHMEVAIINDHPIIKIYSGDPINFCLPSVDPLFRSISKVFKEQAMGILLTGLGNDGVEGLRAIKNAKGITIAESQETSVVYGMPKVAIETGAAQIILPNYQIKDSIIKFSKRSFNVGQK